MSRPTGARHLQTFDSLETVCYCPHSFSVECVSSVSCCCMDSCTLVPRSKLATSFILCGLVICMCLWASCHVCHACTMHAQACRRQACANLTIPGRHIVTGWMHVLWLAPAPMLCFVLCFLEADSAQQASRRTWPAWTVAVYLLAFAICTSCGGETCADARNCTAGASGTWCALLECNGGVCSGWSVPVCCLPPHELAGRGRSRPAGASPHV
jgi:hypothetical protein